MQARQLDSVRIKSIAAEAYTFGYPLVLGKVASQMTASGRCNQFLDVHDDELERSISHGARILSSIAWVDLGTEPVVIALPSTQRFYSLSLFDAWTNALRSFGSRATGYDSRCFAITGPRWQGAEIPRECTRIEAPSSLLRINARTAAYSEADLNAARDFQAGCTIIPLSHFTRDNPKEHACAATPVSQEQYVRALDQMDSVEFFSTMSALLAFNPPLPADQAIREVLETLETSLDHASGPQDLSPEKRAIAEGVRSARRRIQSHRATSLKIGGWAVDLANEQYGRDYLRRAAIARSELFCDIPQDYIRLVAECDAAGDPLDGRFGYRLTFDQGNEPPARGPWFVSTRPLLRSACGIAQRDARGKIEIYIQRNQPVDANQSHWLPVQAGPFKVVLNVFWPSEAILNGGWIPPAVELRS